MWAIAAAIGTIRNSCACAIFAIVDGGATRVMHFPEHQHYPLNREKMYSRWADFEAFAAVRIGYLPRNRAVRGAFVAPLDAIGVN